MAKADQIAGSVKPRAGHKGVRHEGGGGLGGACGIALGQLRSGQAQLAGNARGAGLHQRIKDQHLGAWQGGAKGQGPGLHPIASPPVTAVKPSGGVQPVASTARQTVGVRSR